MVNARMLARIAAVTIASLAVTLTGVTAAQSDVGNGTFDSGVDPWWAYGATLANVEGQLCATSSAANRWDAGVGQNGITMSAGDKEIAFTVTGEGTFKVNVETPEGTSALGQEFTVSGTQTFTYDFTAAETTSAKVLFEVGGNASGHTVCFDNISVTDVAAEPTVLISNDFAILTGGYWAYANGGATSSLVNTDGALCYSTDAVNRWDAGIGYDGWASVAGDATLSFDVKGSGTYKVNVQVPDGTSQLAQEFTVSDPGAWVHQSFDFDIAEGVGKLLFEVGGEDVCLDNIVLSVIESDGPDEPEEPEGPVLQGGVNLLDNGNFAADVAPWSAYGHTGAVTDGAYCGTVTAPLANPWDAGFGYNNLELPAGTYEFSFDASTTGSFTALVQETGGSWTTFAQTPVTGDAMTHYSLSFTLDDPVDVAALQFQFGPLASGSFDACIDNVFLGAPSVEYVTNGTFDDTRDPWKNDGVTSWSIDSGALCSEVPGGTPNPWSVNIHYDGMQLPAGPYTLKFRASGTGGPMRALVGLGASPYTVYTETNATPGADLEEYTVYFTLANASDNAQIAFQVGGSSTPWTFCIDDVSLASGGEKPPYAPETGPRVKVNQHGYLADGPQRATLVTDATDPVAWELVKVGDDVATASGMTTPKGVEPSSGENVHVIDFGGTYAAGTYVLTADGDQSYEFTIGDDLYDGLLTDALNYFYLVRSGIEIDGDIVGEEYARPAGHVSSAGGDAANQGDHNVGCQPAEESLVVYGEPWTCDYTLDVVGGWYDAGDHGKYVVNGGISAAQLLGTYERALRAGSDAVAALADGSLNVPEHGNGVPDILDEAKWELDFMMSMTVPDGEELAGMVHHKVHDYGWTGLPLLPHEDTKVRYLHRPSTAATLNLAADAAQGARLFDTYDPAYAAELLAAAEVAWEAALAHPAIYATAADGSNGGGPYNDDDVSDEFYWAAAELYLTTGDAEYLTYLQNSPVATIDSFPTAGFSWDQLDAIAKIDLATVTSPFPNRHAIAAQVVAGAQAIATVQAVQPFGQALPADKFVWGSSSQVANNVVVLAAGYDLSGNDALKDAAYESMDYLFGRNALSNSYVTGYGTVSSQNQHSRWFAHQLNSELPNPPKGSLAGGPNADYSTWDGTIAGLYPAKDCAPQYCYVDDITSWSTNEITVNWNAALSAAAGFLSAPEAPVTLPDLPFDSAPKPSITGSKALGGTLKAKIGTWDPTPSTVTYQWLRNGKKIVGATTSTYKVTRADSGASLSVTVKGSKTGYVTTSRTSSAVKVNKFFTKTPTPTITGPAFAGYRLTAHPGSWSPSATSFSYQWLRNGKPITSATKSSYVLTKADAGAKITVAVTGKRAGYDSVTKTSAAKTVAKLYFTGWAVPRITGTLAVGHTQKVTVGSWTPKPDSYSYQWYRNGVAIKGATKSTYKLVKADRGTYLSVKVTAHKKGYHDLSIKGGKITRVQ
ncbi:glycoside hydrolase family 9 protein [Demequina sp.]|uniref:glycoside hydrolase family 9 protein n=1 Tax=Demequina sp. TaxID=2050685 RepID=UPI003D13820D